MRTRTAVVLSVASAAGSWPGSLLRSAVSARAYLLGFAALLAVAAVLVWRRPGDVRGRRARECVLEPDLRSCAKLAAAGITLGFLTGFFGVGGGFVIVPVLLLVLAFPVREAVGTSLVVVTTASVLALLASARLFRNPACPSQALVRHSLGPFTVCHDPLPPRKRCAPALVERRC